MIPARAKQSYWDTVHDCLVQFHDLPAEVADRLCDRRRNEVESRPRGLLRDIFYHREAFDVACDLTEKQLDIAQFRHEYDQILDDNHRQRLRG
jgi:hypothetical protein